MIILFNNCLKSNTFGIWFITENTVAVYIIETKLKDRIQVLSELHTEQYYYGIKKVCKTLITFRLGTFFHPPVYSRQPCPRIHIRDHKVC